jgi:glucokinase
MKEVVAGIDIGGTNTVIGLVDRSGNVLDDTSLKTTDYVEIMDYVAAMNNAIEKLLSVNADLKLMAVGIGAPNANYYKGTIELATNLVWKGIVPLCEYLHNAVRVPVVMTNDANAAALGEMIFGGAQNMKDFIVLTLGTGLGSGIVVNGQVVYGHTGFAGELGHMVLVPGGRDCGCGKHGHTETYASATGLVRNTLELLSLMQDPTPLKEVPPALLTSKMIAEAAYKSDPVAAKAIQHTAEMLGFCIINSIIFSSPEAIFLFGGLAQAGEILFTPVRDYVDANVMPLFKGTCKILPSAIPENNAAVLGAAALAWNEIKAPGF